MDTGGVQRNVKPPSKFGVTLLVTKEGIRFVVSFHSTDTKQNNDNKRGEAKIRGTFFLFPVLSFLSLSFLSPVLRGGFVFVRSLFLLKKRY
jgi:hypothetical protein